MTLTAVALIGIGGLLLAWYAVVVGYALATRPRDLVAGPVAMELGAEPPAVVNLLVNRCDLTADAADATLLDLAARGILDLHQPGADPADLLIRVRVAAPAGLTAYEQRVFDRMAAVAGARLVPLREVTRHYADGGPGWFRQLRAEVVEDAERRGLVRDRRFGTPMVFVCLLTAMAIGCLGILPVQRTDDSAAADTIGFASVVGWFFGAVFICVALMMVTLLHTRGARYTDAGRDAGRRWLGVAGWLAAHEDLADLPPAAVAVWDRYLAYGVALGVNPLAGAALDLRVGRVARFTSVHTGAVRTVVVRYPRNPFAYTQAGVRLAWSALVLLAWAGIWSVLGQRIGGWPPALRWPAYAVAVGLPLRAAYRLVRAAIAKAAPVTVTGQVLAAHLFRPRSGGTFGWIQVSVDDGVHDRTRPWLVRADRDMGVRAGDVIEIRAQRWTRYVLRLAVLSRRAAPAVRPPGR